MIVAFTEDDIEDLPSRTSHLLDEEFNPFLHVHIYAVAHTKYPQVRFFSIQRPSPSERQYLFVKVEGLPATPQRCVTKSLANRYKAACTEAMKYANNLYEMIRSPARDSDNDEGRSPSYKGSKFDTIICSELLPWRKRPRYM